VTSCILNKLISSFKAQNRFQYLIIILCSRLFFWLINNLDVYNYIHHNMLFFIHVFALLHWLNIKSDDWQKNEFVMIKNMFKWIFKQNFIILWLTTIMKNEFNMYFWHLQEVKERKNYEWLHNMFYDLIQQIIHQSSVYYLTYVTLHNDHN